MNKLNLILTILSSSIVSAILTSFVTLRIQNLNYKREFYKKNIDKRFKALEYVIKITDELRLTVMLDEGKMCNRIFTQGKDYYNGFYLMMANPVNIIWISKELAAILLDFNIFLLNNITNKIEKNNELNKDNFIKNIGVENNRKIKDFRVKLEKQILTDFTEMVHVRRFIRKSKNKTEKLYHLKK